MLIWILSHALAVQPELVAERLQDIAPLRIHRIGRKIPELPDHAYDGIEKGRVQTGLVTVEGEVARMGWGVAIVDVGIGPLWAAINDEDGKVAWTKADYAEILEGEPCGSTRRVFQYLPVPLFTDRWWVNIQRENDTLMQQSGGKVREMTWTTDGDFSLPTATAKAWGDKGIHVGFTLGAWLLVQLDDDHTLVEYYTLSDPGGQLPARMASSLAANAIDDTIRAMVKGAKEGPGCPIE